LNAFLLIFSIGALVEAILRPINNRTISSCREQWHQVLNLQKLPLSTYPKLAVILLTAISLSGAILSADNYYRLTSEAIYHNPVLSFHEQKYPLNQITIMKQSPIKDNHSKVIGKVYTIVLQNGKRFILSEQLMPENDKRKLDYTTQYISQKTKLPITYSE
jgi:hypothetical protein